MLEVICLPVGSLLSNCYVLYDTESLEAIIIDPGDDGERIVEEIERRSLKPCMIVNTHGHGDHIGANEHVKNHFSIPLLIHRDDAPMLANPDLNLSTFVGAAILSPEPDRLLDDDDTITFGEHTINVLHTPGHSPGGISLQVEDIVFTGDALFQGSVGRTDLPGCSHERLLKGVRTHLLALPDDTRIFPGHGMPSTIGEEKAGNPFL